MQATSYKLIELFALFVLLPVSLVLEYPLLLKLIFGILGFLYIVVYLLRKEKLKFKISKNIDWKTFWRLTIYKFLFIAIITSIYMLIFDADNLFLVILNKPLLWITILFVYSVFSVYPQEVIYRTFFFKRYYDVFKSKQLLIFVNAILFSLAHLFFMNTLVLFLTFVGGLIFAITYNKTKSTMLVSIEHAIYGSWLFTVGMGSMLGFPV